MALLEGEAGRKLRPRDGVLAEGGHLEWGGISRAGEAAPKNSGSV